MLDLLFVAIGVLLLTTGGDALIRGSLAAANRMNGACPDFCVTAIFKRSPPVGLRTQS